MMKKNKYINKQQKHPNLSMLFSNYGKSKIKKMLKESRGKNI